MARVFQGMWPAMCAVIFSLHGTARASGANPFTTGTNDSVVPLHSGDFGALRLTFAATPASPTSPSSSFIDSDRPSTRPRLAWTIVNNKISTEITGGYNLLRRQRLSGLRAGGEVAGGLALAYEAVPHRLWAQGEAQFAIDVERDQNRARPRPAEALLGLRWATQTGWILHGGAGTGLGYGTGSPGLRVLMTMCYQPRRHRAR